jgi:peptidyl-prolyl cis-trans isomerase SurA
VSAAASAETGGDVGWIRSSAIPQELRNTLESMREGEISEPIPSPVGYYIFLLRDRRLNQAAVDRTADDVEVELAQILFPVDAEADIDALRVQAAELRDDIGDCAAMADTAAELNAPESGRLGWLRVGDLPPTLRQAVSSSPVGQVSLPLDGPAGVHLLMVCNRRNAQAETPQREQIAERLQRERVERLARRYLRDLRKEAFVEVRL